MGDLDWKRALEIQWNRLQECEEYEKGKGRPSIEGEELWNL